MGTSAPTTPIPSPAPTVPTLLDNATDECASGNLAWQDEPLGPYVTLSENNLRATKNNHEGADRAYVYANAEWTSGVHKWQLQLRDNNANREAGIYWIEYGVFDTTYSVCNTHQY